MECVNLCPFTDGNTHSSMDRVNLSQCTDAAQCTDASIGMRARARTSWFCGGVCLHPFFETDHLKSISANHQCECYQGKHGEIHCTPYCEGVCCRQQQKAELIELYKIKLE